MENTGHREVQGYEEIRQEAAKADERGNELFALAWRHHAIIEENTEEGERDSIGPILVFLPKGEEDSDEELVRITEDTFEELVYVPAVRAFTGIIITGEEGFGVVFPEERLSPRDVEHLKTVATEYGDQQVISPLAGFGTPEAQAKEAQDVMTQHLFQHGGFYAVGPVWTFSNSRSKVTYRDAMIAERMTHVVACAIEAGLKEGREEILKTSEALAQALGSYSSVLSNVAMATFFARFPGVTGDFGLKDNEAFIHLVRKVVEGGGLSVGAVIYAKRELAERSEMQVAALPEAVSEAGGAVPEDMVPVSVTGLGAGHHPLDEDAVDILEEAATLIGISEVISSYLDQPILLTAFLSMEQLQSLNQRLTGHIQWLQSGFMADAAEALKDKDEARRGDPDPILVLQGPSGAPMLLTCKCVLDRAGMKVEGLDKVPNKVIYEIVGIVTDVEEKGNDDSGSESQE
jgi:hypothetical protein